MRTPISLAVIAVALPIQVREQILKPQPSFLHGPRGFLRHRVPHQHARREH